MAGENDLMPICDFFINVKPDRLCTGKIPNPTHSTMRDFDYNYSPVGIRANVSTRQMEPKLKKNPSQFSSTVRVVCICEQLVTLSTRLITFNFGLHL